MGDQGLQMLYLGFGIQGWLWVLYLECSLGTASQFRVWGFWVIMIKNRMNEAPHALGFVYQAGLLLSLESGDLG